MKHFLVILGVTAIVWLGVSISEPHEYPLHVGVDIEGVDTVRYAVVYADTAMDLNVEMPGFSALLLSTLDKQPRIEVNLSQGGLQRAVAVVDLNDNIRQQLANYGVKRVAGGHDSIRLRMAPRSSRRIPVRLDSVDFSFSEQYGLYGEPRIEPAEVTLYGADSLLATISEVQVASSQIVGISSTSTYRLPLDPAWRRMGDVRASASEVEVYLPVEAYVEREYSVPIEVDGADTTVRLRLYPPEAKVRAWVAKCDLQRTPDFRVAIDYGEVLAGATRQKPRLIEFPAYLRPRSVEPQEVQCLVIK